MTSAPGISLPGGAPWYRVVAIPDVGYGGTADRDYAAVLPAALDAAASKRPFVTGWLSHGGGAPLELITNSGPLPPGPPPSGLPAHPLPSGPPALPVPPAPAGNGQPEPAAPELASNGRPELLFPWGARGVAGRPGLAADLAALTWAPCPGRQAQAAGQAGGQGAAGWPGNGSGPAGQAGTGGYSWLPAGTGLAAPTLFESALSTLMSRPFGWLVVAEPSDRIDAEIAALRARLNVLRRYDEEGARFDADRAASRLAELDAFREAGLWNVRVLVGAADAAQLGVIAPMLVGAADLSAHPYRLRGPEQPPGDLAAALAAAPADQAGPADRPGPSGPAAVADPAGQARGAVPFSATAGLLAALAGLPRREVPGVRLLDVGYFDVTAEPAPGAEVGVGTILDGQDRPVGTMAVPLATLNRHALITGATGSGKSQTVRHLLGQLTAAQIPWLVVEPVKSEYGAMAGRIAGAGAQLTLINPADPAAVPIAVNPLAPEPGYPVQAHIDMVRALFLAAFDAHEPFPQIMSQALQRVYESCGWDPVSGVGRPGAAVPPAVPTLAQLQAAALEVIEDVGYGPELQADVRGFVDVRLRSLRTGSAGRFFEGGHPADIAELLRRDAVLAIEDVANDEDKAFLIGTLIIRITEHLRLRARAAGNGEHPGRELRHVIVIEEAHRLLRAGREGAGAHAVELFASMLAEIRAYGEGLLIAEQIPAKLVPDVVKNTALKIVHRLPAHDDRELVGATMNLDAEQSRQVVSFPPGVAAVFADGMDRPVRVQVPFGGQAERPPGPGELAAPPIAARRSAACGSHCAGERACSLLELRTADLEARSSRSAWLRVWTEAMVLAFLTNSPLPVVPAALRAQWSGLDPRLRECVLATVAERAVAARSQAIREFFAPERLTTAVAGAASRMLGGGKGAGSQPGRDWVIPQLQWLHEIERALPLTGPSVDPFELALPLEFELPGLVDRPDIKVGQRISALRRHALSMELDSNRLPAWTVLLGEDDQRAFCADLAILAVGASHRGQLLQAAGEMGVAGWLEPVLSWPRRFIVGYDASADQAERALAAGGHGSSN